MSQFILFTAKEKNVLFSDLRNNTFLQNYAKLLFQTNDLKNMYTFLEFDDLCMNAQNVIANGVSIYSTNLFKFIELIKDEEIYFWYGSEHNDLDEISNFQLLVEKLYRYLTEASGEIYIHYKKR